MNKPVAIPFAWYCAWLGKDDEPVWEQYEECHPASKEWDNFPDKIIPLYTHPVKELTDEKIDSVVHELRQKSFDPERWLDVYTVAIETIIQLRDELAILRKASE